jgi:signal transduction histidine kinase
MEKILTKNKVLLVDDEQDVRDVLQIALWDAGYEVITAEEGRQAVELFRNQRPPIVITDIKMPGMDGIQLLKLIKADNAETEVIMITGHGDMDLAIRSLKHEATDFITKPINVDVLEIALRRAQERILIRQKLSEYTASLEELVRQKMQLQDHLASLGLMIGTISHGIKGLLTGLDGGMYLLESGLARKEDTKIQEGWEMVKLVVDRIRKMVMDILFYAKKRDLQWERIDVAVFTREIVRMVESKVEGLPIEFEYRITEELGDCFIDAGYVHAALMNLVENAIDACQRDTECRQHRILFTVRPANGNIHFDIMDTGVGMDLETQSKLFTLFFSSKGRQGTGLGLFIANKIIEQHGGSITVSSAPGRGSRFTISLPRQNPPASNA